MVKIGTRGIGVEDFSKDIPRVGRSSIRCSQRKQSWFAADGLVSGVGINPRASIGEEEEESLFGEQRGRGRGAGTPYVSSCP